MFLSGQANPGDPKLLRKACASAMLRELLDF
jgi:hypothetical protein